MIYALNLAEDGRVLSATYPQYAPEGAVTVLALPDCDLYDYCYDSGEFVYDPLPKPEQPEDEPKEDDTSVWDELDAAYQEGVDSI